MLGFTPKNKEETGDMILLGSGNQTIMFPFKPSSFAFDIKDDPNGVLFSSCNPTDLDEVHVATECRKGNFYLKIKWKVFRIKHLVWKVTSP